MASNLPTRALALSVKREDPEKTKYRRASNDKLLVIIGVKRRDIAGVIKGNARSAEETTSMGVSPALPGIRAAQNTLAHDIFGQGRANEDLYAFVFLPTEGPASLIVLLVLNHEEGDSGTRGDGQKSSAAAGRQA